MRKIYRTLSFWYKKKPLKLTMPMLYIVQSTVIIVVDSTYIYPNISDILNDIPCQVSKNNV